MNIIYKVTFEGKTHLLLGSMHHNADYGIALAPQNIAKYVPSVKFHNFYTELPGMLIKVTYRLAYMFTTIYAAFSKDSINAFLDRDCSKIYSSIIAKQKEYDENMLNSCVDIGATVINARAERPLRHKAAESYILSNPLCKCVSIRILSLVRFCASFFLHKKDLDVYNSRGYMFSMMLTISFLAVFSYTGLLALQKGCVPYILKGIVNNLILYSFIISLMCNKNMFKFSAYKRAVEQALGLSEASSDNVLTKECHNEYKNEFVEPRNYIQANAILAETENSIFMYGAAHLEAPITHKSIIDILRDNGAEIEYLEGGKWEEAYYDAHESLPCVN